MFVPSEYVNVALVELVVVVVEDDVPDPEPLPEEPVPELPFFQVVVLVPEVDELEVSESLLSI